MTELSPSDLLLAVSEVHRFRDWIDRFRSCTLPRPPSGRTLEELGLDPRCIDALAEHGIADAPHRLAELTIDDFLSLPGLGVEALDQVMQQAVRWTAVGQPVRRDEDPLAAAQSLLQCAGLPALSEEALATRLPAPPPGCALVDLGLDNRTTNVLTRQGFAGNLSALGLLTVRDAMTLGGFGRKCLKNYLEAMVRAHSAPSSPERGNQPVVALLDDLVDRVERGLVLQVAEERLPDLPPGMTVGDLQLSIRAANCLANVGIDDGAAAFGSITIGELLQRPNFGVTSMLNLLTALRAAHTVGIRALRKELAGEDFEDLTPERIEATRSQLVEQIQGMSPSFTITIEDPRFAGALQRAGAASLDELLAALAVRTPGARIMGAAVQLRDALQAALATTIESELLAMVGCDPLSRNARVIRDRLGLGAAQEKTLQEVGQLHGITRERVRQICAFPRTGAAAVALHRPVFDAVAARIRAAMPVSVAAISADLANAGLIERASTAAVFLRCCDYYGDEPDCEVAHLGELEALVRRGEAKLLEEVRSMLLRAIWIHGAVQSDTFVRQWLGDRPGNPGPLLSFVLANDPSLQVVTNGAAWVVARSTPAGSSRFVQRIGEVLQVAPRLPLEDLRRALRREYRNGPFVPDVETLELVVRNAQELRVDGEGGVEWHADFAPPTVAGDAGRLVSVLESMGGCAGRVPLQKACEAAGVSGPSFWRLVSYSSLIRQIERGVYALVGQEPDATTVADLQRSNGRVPGGVRDTGWTAGGEFWLAATISSATLETGVIGVPRVAHAHMHDSYDLIGVSGDRLGDLTFRNGSLWSIRAAIVELGAEAGDAMVIRFDVATRVARVEVGDDSLIDRYVAGPS